MWVDDGVGVGVQDVLPGGRVRAASIAKRGPGECAGEPDEVVRGSAGADHAAVVVGHTLALSVIPARHFAADAGIADGEVAAAAAVSPWGQDDCRERYVCWGQLGQKGAVGASRAGWRQLGQLGTGMGFQGRMTSR